MRVGVMTLRFHNYGTILQALGLQHILIQLLKSSTIDVEMINCYANRADEGSSPATHLLYKPAPETQRRYAEARELFLDHVEYRRQLFRSFVEQHIKLSEYYKDFRSLKSAIYDVYITGGDQTMSLLSYYNKEQFPYLLAFTDSKNKIAYGCGMHKDATKPFRIEFMSLPLLSQYKKIMVRETLGAETLSRYLNRTIEVVLDPVLLLNAEDYLPFMTKPAVKINDNYIFAYFLNVDDNNDHERLICLLTEFARKEQKKILLVSSNIPINNEFVTTVVEAGPAEWLWLMANAENILTNTYHGAAFAVLFNKPFYAVGKDARKADLLDTLGLSGHLGPLDDLQNRHGRLEVDYSAVNGFLHREQARCKKLLKESVEMCKEEKTIS